MIMVSFPFDSKITGYDSDNYPIYDRAVDSSTLSTMINEFVSTGVFPKEQDGFTVTAGDGMTVNVSPGSAIIKGTTCIEKDARTLTIQAADSTYDRIDSVILRYDNNENVRAIDLYVLKGTAASAPVQPALTRNDAIFEIALANIYIPVNSTTISDERITDTRGDTSRCGWATGVSQDFMESINNRFAVVNEGISNNTANIANNTTNITKNTTSITNLNNKVTNLKAIIENYNTYEQEFYYSNSGVDELFSFTIHPKDPGYETAISEDISDRYNYFNNFSVIRRLYGPYGDIDYTISCKSSNSGFYFKVRVVTMSCKLRVI